MKIDIDKLSEKELIDLNNAGLLFSTCSMASASGAVILSIGAPGHGA